MIVTITGENTFLRAKEIDTLVSSFIAEHTDMAVERFDGEEVNLEQIRASIQSMPFLTARKLVILREPGTQKSFAEAITDLLVAIPDTTDIIIVEPKLDKRLGYYKALKKMTDFRDFSELDANGLAKWAVAYVQSRNGQLTIPDAKFIIDRVRGSQQMLQGELDKLLAYSPVITKQIIELLTDVLPQSTVFELLDAACNGNVDRAMALYAEQRSLRVEPQAILAMLAWQLQILAVVKAGASKTPDEIAKAAKLNPYVVRKSQTAVRRLSFDQLKALIAELLSIDIRLKRSSVDADDILQLFILRLAQ